MHNIFTNDKKFSRVASALGTKAKVVSIQNSYSLLTRSDFENGLSEVCYHHRTYIRKYTLYIVYQQFTAYTEPFILACIHTAYHYFLNIAYST